MKVFLSIVALLLAAIAGLWHFDRLPLMAAAPSYSTNGIWSGHFDINGRGHFDFTALYIDGEAVAVSNDTNMVYYGRVKNQQNRYESQLTMYLKSRGSKFGQVELQGEFITGNKIDAQFLTIGPGDSGKLSLSNNTELFHRAQPVEQLLGEWILYRGMTILKFNFDAKGYIRGADTTGCEYEGSIVPKKPDVNINAYQLHFSVSSCNFLDGEMHGIAYLSSSLETDDTLNMHLFNKESGLYLPIVRDKKADSDKEASKPL